MAEDALYLDECTEGVLINFCGSVLVNGGTNCMKLGVVLREAYRVWRPAWYAGALGFVVGNVLNFVSFGMAPQSLLACVGAIQFLTNLFFARVLLGEVVSMRACAASAVIISGTLIAVRSAPHRSVKPTVDDMIGYYFRPAFQTYAAAMLAMVVALEVAFRKARFQAFYRPLCYGATSAMIGTFSVVQGKCLAVLITEIHNSKRRGSSVRVMTLVSVAIVTLVSCQAFWLGRMQRAMELFDASVIPVLQVCWTVFCIVTGGIFFCELQMLPTERLLFFSFGLIVMMSGVYLLLPRPSHEVLPDPEQGSTPTYDVINRRSYLFRYMYEIHDSVALGAAAVRNGNTFAGRSFLSRTLVAGTMSNDIASSPASDEEPDGTSASDDELSVANTKADAVGYSDIAPGPAFDEALDYRSDSDDELSVASTKADADAPMCFPAKSSPWM